MPLYPLKFKSIFKYRIWGGEKLKTILNKKYSESSIGESWELSDVPGDESLISNGHFKGKTLNSLLKTYPNEILGTSVYKKHGIQFPLLLKFIDAKTPLSIQVHPNDELAKKRKNSLGKSEMWYVMESDNNAELIVGFKEKETKETYAESIKTNKIVSLLNTVKVKKGDTFYIPAGRIHAIGSGVMLAEIQQTSDITYRIYDYDRVDKKTNSKRALHTEESLDAIDFEVKENYNSYYKKDINKPNELVYSPYFKTDITFLKGELTKDYSKKDSFIIYMCVSGELMVTYNKKEYSLENGEVLLLPASINEVSLKGEAELIEVFM